MNFLAALFGAGVTLRNALYDRGWAPTRRLDGPVIGIGNLSAGGSGKTPFVILLGELLRRHNLEFDVLSRGYKRSSRGAVVVEPAGSAREFGDEPLLIARRLGVPVIVGESRYEAGRLAESKFGPRLHLLDDAFQHRQLARDFDIVLVTAQDAGDQLLPAGRLRELPAALRRADAVVLNEEEFHPGKPKSGLPGTPPAGLPLEGKLVWRIRRGLHTDGAPPRPVAFCGIARPQRFFAQLRAAGIEAVVERSFRDHHSYSAGDVAGLERTRQRTGAGGFITTEKDALNLGPLAERLRPLAVAPVIMELEDAETALAVMLSRIAERRRLLRQSSR
jgi:tetraacyldisaccharide 4'-kinase